LLPCPIRGVPAAVPFIIAPWSSQEHTAPCSIRNSALLPLSLKSEAQISSGSRSKQVCPKISLLPIYPTPNSPIPQPAIDSVRRNKTQSSLIKLRAFFSLHSAFRSPARSASRNMPKTVFSRWFKPIQGDFNLFLQLNPQPAIDSVRRNKTQSSLIKPRAFFHSTPHSASCLHPALACQPPLTNPRPFGACHRQKPPLFQPPLPSHRKIPATTFLNRLKPI
jgi:hypothetical protein